ncbi:hypothetical protein D3C86_2198730 [compost metagenome]
MLAGIGRVDPGDRAVVGLEGVAAEGEAGGGAAGPGEDAVVQDGLHAVFLRNAMASPKSI